MAPAASDTGMPKRTEAGCGSINPRSDRTANPSSNSEVKAIAAISSDLFISIFPLLSSGNRPSFHGDARFLSYVCHPTYYEGRHTDLQLIFSRMAKASDSKGKTLTAAAKL